MVSYADTSLLVSVYAFEDAADEARGLLGNLHQPIQLNLLLWLEMRNAIRRKVPTAKATKAQVTDMLSELDKSAAEGAFEFREIDFRAAFDRAEDLSVRFTAKLNSRAFDLLHVAIALETDCREFLTFDRDQAKVAKAVGLTVKSN